MLLQPLLMGIATYALMRQYSLSKIASVLSAVSAMFCGFMVVWMAYGTLSLAFAFLPFALVFIEKYKNSQKARYLFLFSLTIPLSFFSGHFQTSVYVALFIFAYLIFNILFEKKRKIVLLLLAAFFSGVLMTMIQVIPAVEFYSYTVRSEIFNNSDGIPFSYLITTFAPDFFGNPVTRNDYFGYYAEYASFVGIIPLIFALFAFINIKKGQAVTKFFLIVAISALVLALQSPIQAVIGFLRIPVISTSNPTRIIALFSFSVCLLAGFGFDAFWKEKIKGKVKSLLIVLLCTLSLFALIWLLVLFGNFVPLEFQIIAKRNFILPSLMVMAASVLIIFGLVVKNPKIIFFLSILLVVLAGLDSLRFVTKWIPVEEKSLVFKETKVVNELKKNTGEMRYFGNLGAQVASYYGLQSLDGYDPLYIKRYGQFIQYAHEGRFQEAQRSVVQTPRIGDNVDRVINLLSVNTVFHPRADTNQSWAYHVWDRPSQLLKIYQDDKFELYQNTHALNRFFLFYNYEVQEGKNALTRFYDSKFDYREKLILDHEIDFQPTSGSGSAEITKYSANNVKGKVVTDKEALLFLADNNYPGWKAYLDGKETEILNANYTFRAIMVPKGEHSVEFSYQPESFRIGGLTSLAGFSGLILVLIFNFRLKSRYN